MSNQENEARDRAASEADVARAQQTARTGSGSGEHLEGLDRTDANVLSPAGLGPDNPHAGGDRDLGQAEMQSRMDRISAEGRIGASPDPTPDENYSLLTPPDAPTPETDPELAAQVAGNVRGNPFVNTGLTTAQTAAGAEAPTSAATKTPGESQAEIPNAGDTTTTTETTTTETTTTQGDTTTPPETEQNLTDEEQAKVQALVAGGASQDEATAQVLAERGAS